MDNLNELGIKFGEGTTWIQKEYCAWCPSLRKGRKSVKLHQTKEKYIMRGNMCNECSTIITDKVIESINQERRRKVNEKKKLLDTLGKSLNQNMSEEDRQKIEELMKTIHAEIIYTETALESGM